MTDRETKTVKMLIDQRGSEDGFNIQMFKKGKAYDMELSLADAFITEGWAEQLLADKPKKKTTKKAVRGAPENKMLDGAPEDKADNEHNDPNDEDEYSEPDAGEDGGEVDPAEPDGAIDPPTETPDDYPPLSYAKHTAFGRWYVFSQDGAKLSGPHSKADVIEKGFET